MKTYGSTEEENISEDGSNEQNCHDEVPKKKKTIHDEIMSIAVPALAGLAIDPLMTLADTVFVGRNSSNADALAGMGSAASLVTFSFYIFNFLCTVTTPIVSKRRASGDTKGAIEIGELSLGLAIFLGCLLSTILIMFSDPALEIMGTGKENSRLVGANIYATSFLRIRAIAAPAVFIISAATGILRGYLDTKTTFVILLFANSVNILFDVVLIAWLKMGPKGAAIATTTAEWLSAVLLLLCLAGKIPSIDRMLGSNQRKEKKSNSINNKIRDEDKESYQNLTEIKKEEKDSTENEFISFIPKFHTSNWQSIKPLIVASSSVFIRSTMLQFFIVGASAMAARSSSTFSLSTENSSAAPSLSAHAIAFQIFLLCSFICDSLAAASQALVSDRLGIKDPDGVRNVTQAIFKYSLEMSLILALLLILGDFSGFLLGLFTSDSNTQEELKPLLIVLIIGQPLNSFVFAADGVLQGAAEFTYQAKTMMLSVLVGISSFLWFDFNSNKKFNGDNSSPLIHVWYAIFILQFMRGLTSLWKLVDSEGPIDLFSRSSCKTMVKTNGSYESLA